MNAVISGSNIKIFSSALQCLSRFADAFWLQVSPRQDVNPMLRLSAINSTNSAFCMFSFDHEFFLRATVTSTERIECQVGLKAVLAILRTRGKTVERCELELNDSSSEECRFIIKLHCNHGIVKTHKLTYEPKRGLLPIADPNPPNYFCINAQTAHEWTEHFLSSSKNGEITFWCGTDFCIVKSKEDELPEAKGQLRRAIHTEVKIDLDEFREYSVQQEVIVTFSLKEFKATVTLAEMLQIPLQVHFNDGNQPLFIRLNMEFVSAELVIATTRGEKPNLAGQESSTNQPQSNRNSVDRTTVHPPAQAASSGATTRESGSAARHISSESEANGRSRLEEETSLGRQSADDEAVVPMESTHLPEVAAIAARSENKDMPAPLFFPGASQESDGIGSQNYSDHRSHRDAVGGDAQRSFLGNQVRLEDQVSAEQGTANAETSSVGRYRQDQLVVEPSQFSNDGDNLQGRLGGSNPNSESEEEEELVVDTDTARKRFKPLFF